MTAPEYAQARALRRRRLHQRQTVLLGVLIVLLLATGFVSWMMWLKVIPSPFARDFSTTPPEETNSTVACPPEGALTTGYSDITAAVYNSTDRSGLARSVGAALSGVGVNVNQTGNWEEPVLGVGFLRTGVNGLEEAYTLQLAFPGMIVTKDAREDALVDIVLGSDYTAMGDLTLIASGVPITMPPECVPGAETTPPAEPAPTETPAPTEPPAGAREG